LRQSRFTSLLNQSPKRDIWQYQTNGEFSDIAVVSLHDRIQTNSLNRPDRLEKSNPRLRSGPFARQERCPSRFGNIEE